MFVLICIGAFVGAFALSNAIHLAYANYLTREYRVNWSDEVGTVRTDLAYGEGDAQKYDLYLPADSSKDSYGLIVYLHAGGFTTGDKSGDAETLEYFCSLGYVPAGINYTLASEENHASVYTQSEEIKAAVPQVVEKARELGYNVDRMAMAGGSAGGALALIYAYRDADEAPAPVRMVFEAVGPSSFYPEDWTSYGTDQSPEAAAALFSAMRGEAVDPDILGTPAYDELMKPISPLLWVEEDTVPTVMAYGKYDRVQPYAASVRLDRALTEAGVDHAYIVCEHSGHGLQNDLAEGVRYNETVNDYLDRYMAS